MSARARSVLRPSTMRERTIALSTGSLREPKSTVSSCRVTAIRTCVLVATKLPDMTGALACEPTFQRSLFGEADREPALGPLLPTRTTLTEGAWIDTRPGWLSGADALFEALVGAVPWRAERRQMYDRT